jgi:uncharacterized protein Veg
MFYTHLKCRNKSPKISRIQDKESKKKKKSFHLSLKVKGERKKERKNLPRARDFFVSVFIIFISSFLSARETPNNILSSTATSQ